MTQSMIIQLARDALTVSMMVGAPIMAVSLVIGILVSVFQAVTQIQEMTLSFVPKVLGVSVAVLVFGPWMLSTLVAYTANLLISLPTMAK